MQQLASYICTYTKGSLFHRVNKTKKKDVDELLREIIQKGKNHNKNRLLTLKAQAYSPPRATKVEELETILTEWKHNLDQIEVEDKSFQIDDDTRMTILMKVMPKEYVKDMREKYHKDEYKDDYHKSEQALFDEILTRKMDD